MSGYVTISAGAWWALCFGFAVVCVGFICAVCHPCAWYEEHADVVNAYEAAYAEALAEYQAAADENDLATAPRYSA